MNQGSSPRLSSNLPYHPGWAKHLPFSVPLFSIMYFNWTSPELKKYKAPHKCKVDPHSASPWRCLPVPRMDAGKPYSLPSLETHLSPGPNSFQGSRINPFQPILFWHFVWVIKCAPCKWTRGKEICKIDPLFIFHFQQFDYDFCILVGILVSWAEGLIS